MSCASETKREEERQTDQEMDRLKTVGVFSDSKLFPIRFRLFLLIIIIPLFLSLFIRRWTLELVRHAPYIWKKEGKKNKRVVVAQKYIRDDHYGVLEFLLHFSLPVSSSAFSFRESSACNILSSLSSCVGLRCNFHLVFSRPVATKITSSFMCPWMKIMFMMMMEKDDSHHHNDHMR